MIQSFVGAVTFALDLFAGNMVLKLKQTFLLSPQACFILCRVKLGFTESETELFDIVFSALVYPFIFQIRMAPQILRGGHKCSIKLFNVEPDL